MRTSRNILGVAIVAAAFSGAASADIMNPGFETGDLSDWNTAGAVYAREWEMSRDFVPPIHDDWAPTEGLYFASLWSYDPVLGSNAQISTTFDATAGDVLSFDYFFDYGDVNPNFDTAVGTLTIGANQTTLFEWNTAGHQLGTDNNVDWTTVTHTLTEAGQYTLTFRTSDANAGFESILGVDNVSLVPEPSALTLLALGAIGLLRRR